MTTCQADIAIDDLAFGVLALLSGEPLPPPSPERSFNKTLYWLVLLIPLVLVVGILWSLISLRRWRRGDGSQPWGWFGWVWRVIVPSLLYLAEGWLLLVELAPAFGLPLSALRLLAPDLGLSVIIGGMLGLVWGILWPVLVYFSLRPTARQRQVRPVLAHA